MKEFIKIRGARVHNLKNIDVDIPKNKLVAITGISGSGKSSLAFDTLYAEGQRRYIESLSAYARQFLGVMQKPDVDKIEGISPAISIDQKKASRNPRSTVGTMTEIYDYLRLLFAKIGTPHCPECKKAVSRQNINQIKEQILKLPRKSEILILSPVVRGKKGEYQGTLEEIKRAGFVRIRIDGIIHRTEESLSLGLDRKKKHHIEVVVDRLILDKEIDKSRLVDSLKAGLKIGKGIIIINQKKNDLVFSEHFSCQECGISFPELEPRLFSFNSPYGACPACQGLGERLEVDPKLVIPNPNLSIAEGAIFPWAGASLKTGKQLEDFAGRKNIDMDVPVKELPEEKIKSILEGDDVFAAPSKRGEPRPDRTSGWEGVIPWLERKYRQTDSDYAREEIEKYMVERKCEKCQGKRLRPEALAVTIAGKSIDNIVENQIDKIKHFFKKVFLKGSEKKIASPVIKEIVNRLQFLIDVGLDYLTLDRKATSLAGGEEQRIRLATQIGSQITGVIYVLDEPSVGLHARDQEKLINTFKKLKDLGNTVLVVEHDPQTIKEADWVIDIGPGAGKHGGRLTFEGTPKELLKSKTLTGEYLSGRKKVEVKSAGNKQEAREAMPAGRQDFLIIKGAQEHNLKNIDVRIPLGKFVCITGVSGSGKSSLMNDILAKALMKKFYNSKEEPGKHREISGIGHLNKVILVDQSAIGRTPRSNPATYTGCFSYVRDIFSETKEARTRRYQPGRFSFNVEGGRCETCEGQGQIKIEMFFLPDVYQECQECKGKRFNKETLSVEYKGKNIAEVLEMTTEEALEFFKGTPGLHQKLATLNQVGLSYLQLGQPAPSLSGGEAQRIKLATELGRKATGKTLYILDEPTTGLHPDDIKKLLYVLKELVNRGSSVLCIEHNFDVIKNSDWIIDLGPEGGEKGGYIVAEGPLLEISKNKQSHTGRYLKSYALPRS